ncbi:MAG: hypothetical protein U9R72_17205 [Chloroflexota bacterium]|nr:hypothetical protein [Chloroflexota bacterium]
MKRSRPAVVTYVAILQFIPAFLLPPEILLSAPPLLLLIPAALFVFMGWGLLTLKPWATTFCIFVQGFNTITRFLILWPQTSPGETTDWAFVLTSLVSIALSSVILHLIDRPSVQVAFQT